MDFSLNDVRLLATRLFLVGLWVLPVIALISGTIGKRWIFIVGSLALTLNLVAVIAVGIYLLETQQFPGATGMEGLAYLFAIGYLLVSLFISSILFIVTE